MSGSPIDSFFILRACPSVAVPIAAQVCRCRIAAITVLLIDRRFATDCIAIAVFPFSNLMLPRHLASALEPSHPRRGVARNEGHLAKLLPLWAQESPLFWGYPQLCRFYFSDYASFLSPAGNNKKSKALGEDSQATEGALYERNGIVFTRRYGRMDTQFDCISVAFAECSIRERT